VVWVARVLVPAGLAGALLILVRVPPTHADLLIYKATEDGEAFAKNPQKFDKVVDPSQSATVYVERTPVMRIQLSEIESVEVEEHETLSGGPEDIARELFDKNSGKSQTRKDQGKRDLYYQVTFFLSNEGHRKLKGFGRKYKDGLFDIRLNDRRIGEGIHALVGPLEGRALGIYSGRKRDEIEAILSPVKEKVTWK